MRALVIALLLSAAPKPPAQTLTVLAAASLARPLKACAADFERAHPGVRLAVSSAATGALVRQVQAGAPADVFVGAAEPPVLALQKQRLLGPSRHIARNGLVLAAPSTSKATAPSLRALEGPGFTRIGIGRPKLVPAGDYAVSALTHLGLYTALEPKLVFGQSVTQVLTWIRAGDVDAGLVYASDAASVPTEVQVLARVDPALHPPIVYPAAALTHAVHPALAAAYLDFLRSPVAQAALHRAGFLPP